MYYSRDGGDAGHGGCQEIIGACSRLVLTATGDSVVPPQQGNELRRSPKADEEIKNPCSVDAYLNL